MKEPSNLRKWNKQQIKGAFYLNEDGKINTNSYFIELHENSKVFFEIEPQITDLHSSNSFYSNFEKLELKLITLK